MNPTHSSTCDLHRESAVLRRAAASSCWLGRRDASGSPRAALELDHDGGRLHDRRSLEPGLEASSSAASRVMTATTRAGSVTSISTCASSPSTVTSRTTPRKRFRALRCSTWSPPEPRHLGRGDEPPVGRVALGPDAPARSQRLSVSSEMPSARAASAAGTALLIRRPSSGRGARRASPVTGARTPPLRVRRALPRRASGRGRPGRPRRSRCRSRSPPGTRPAAAPPAGSRSPRPRRPRA